MMSMALGLFGWSPATFWSATPHEWFACLEHHERVARAHG